MKTKLREYVNGGHNVTDTLEFFEALQSGIPLNSTSYYVVDVLSSKPGTGSIPGIKSFSSFLSEVSLSETILFSNFRKNSLLNFPFFCNVIFSG